MNQERLNHLKKLFDERVGPFVLQEYKISQEENDRFVMIPIGWTYDDLFQNTFNCVYGGFSISGYVDYLHKNTNMTDLAIAEWIEELNCMRDEEKGEWDEQS